MLKWNQIDDSLLKDRKWLVLKHQDQNLAHEAIGKRILGIEGNAIVPGFEFELRVFGYRSECFLAAKFMNSAEHESTVLASGKAVPIEELFTDEACKDDLLNLFDSEQDSSPGLLMLKAFINSNKKDFQKLNDSESSFWMSRWSDVNSWACFWKVGNTFHCLAKQSG